MTTGTAKSYSFTVEPYDEYFFEGLGRQNMSFHYAVAELVDNAIAASQFPFFVNIWLEQRETGTILLRISDQGSGMTVEDMTTRALKLGGRPNSDSRLNEHGWGMKNALCALTGNINGFLIQTRDDQAVADGIFSRFGDRSNAK